MANLQELRNRKKSVQATRKITAAMKMIAAAKLKKAQERAQEARMYAQMMIKMLEDVMTQRDNQTDTLPLLNGTGKKECHLIVAITSDRGLCGGFNAVVVKEVIRLIQNEKAQSHQIKILCIGYKGYEQLKRDYGTFIHSVIKVGDKPKFRDAARISTLIQTLFTNQDFDICTIVYNKFISALQRDVTQHRLIPIQTPEHIRSTVRGRDISLTTTDILYEYEPSRTLVLAELLPKNLSTQIYQTLLESAASEHGARMTAMDSATHNAEDMIHDISLRYNRTRQAQITRELIEIISGAEAL